MNSNEDKKKTHFLSSSLLTRASEISPMYLLTCLNRATHTHKHAVVKKLLLLLRPTMYSVHYHNVHRGVHTNVRL